MREIKFRAWHESLNEMLYQFTMPMAGSGRDINRAFSQLNAPIMQFTGLKDKNGKEIYEGDVVFYEDHEWTVEWWYDRWDMVNNGKHVREDDFSDDPGYTDWEKCNVIGNIYENQI